MTSLLSEGSGDFRVKHKDKGSSNGTEGVGTSSLEQGRNSFFLHNLLETVSSTAVDPFFLGLLRLHLKTTTDGVEGVRSVSGSDGRSLGADELGSGTDETIVDSLVRVVSGEGIEETKVDSTVGDDTNNGDTNTVVETSKTGALDSLGETVNKTVELLLAGTDIRGKTGTGIVKRVNNHERSGTSQTSRGHVDQEEGDEVLLLVNLGEHGLDGVLEGEVEGLGGEITDDVGQVTTPESTDSLLGSNAGEAVNNTGVSGDLSGDDLGVGILSLDKKLNTLNWGSRGLGDSTGDTTGQKVDEEITSRRHC